MVCVDGLIVNEDRHILLVRRTLPPLRWKWWLPGGRVRRGELLGDAFRRIMREELGVTIHECVPFGVYEGRHTTRHDVSLVFVSHIPRATRIRLDRQASEWVWAEHLPTAFCASLHSLP
jgi:colanic acid biosynthesis protein WcaH